MNYVKETKPEQKYGLLYCRISLILDREKLLEGKTMSTEHQYAIMEEYCQKNDIIILEKFNDLSISGKNISDRPALRDLLSKLDKNMVVICENVARLSRNTEDLMYIYKLIKSREAELVILDISLDSDGPQIQMYTRMMQAYNKYHWPESNIGVKIPTSFDSPEGQLYLQLLGEYATLTRIETGNKVSKCMNEAIKKGTVRTKPKFGYKIENKSYVEIPEEQKIIKYIKALLEYDPKLTASQISRGLNKQGFVNKKGHVLHVSTIDSIVREIQNPTMPALIEKYNKIRDEICDDIPFEKNKKTDYLYINFDEPKNEILNKNIDFDIPKLEIPLFYSLV